MIVIVHSSLFEAMYQAADHLKLSSAFVADLKSEGVMEIGEGLWNFLLKIEFIDDKIEGFKISLLAAENAEDFEEIKAKVAADKGFSLEEVEGFELEHGLKLNEDTFEEMEASYGVTAKIEEDEVIFELVIFDSQDLDNSLKSVEAWGEEPSAN